MKKIILYFFIITICLFADNYDDMFSELEGITSIVILDSDNKEAIEGAKVQVNNLKSFSDGKGIAKYKPSEEELAKGKIALLTIEKGSYLTYQGNFRVGTEKKIVYLEKDVEIPVKKIEKAEDTGNIKALKKDKVLSSKVRVVALDDGVLYLADKKLRSIRAGRESFFRIKEGLRTLTLDTEKAIYRKDIKVVAPEMLVVFNKVDIIKVKEAAVVKPVKAPAVKEVVNKVPKKEKIVKSLEIPEEITNEYLIAEIIGPLEDGSAFNITTNSTYFEMKEDENKGEFVTFKLSDGKEGKMKGEYVRPARRIIGNNKLLDDYYYVVTNLEVEFKEDYLNKVEAILNKIAIEKQEYISTNSKWNTEDDGIYIALSSAKRIENDEILNKLYRISYKNTITYSDFFRKLDNTISREREYQIKLFDKKEPTTVFNMMIDGYHPYQSYDSVNTNLGNKEISSKYSSMGRYLGKLDYSLLGSLYKESNEYYFLNNSIAKMSVHLLKENDGRKIIRSDCKKVK